ncbi:ribonuclease H-like domain-containing protein [Tanacetum coccineum]
MSTQQDIYGAGFKNRPPMLNKDNYVPWSSRLLRYAKSKPNGKLLVNSFKNGPYVRRMIIEAGDLNSVPPGAESSHDQIDDEQNKKEAKQMEADDQTMKCSTIRAQEKKAKLFNEWEKLKSTKGESIESNYHRFSNSANHSTTSIDVAVSFDSAVHRDHAGSFDAAVLSLVSAACCTAAGYLVYCCCLPCSFLNSIPADNVPAGRSSSIPADYVSAGHVLVPADKPMPTIPTQSPFTYPIPNSSASPSVTQDDTFMPNPSASPSFTQDDTFMPEPIQPMPTFTQTAFSQPAVHTQHTHPAQTNPTGQQYPNNVQSQQFQQFQTATISANNAKFPYLEKEKYEIWAMKMEYWIQNADHNLWRIVQQGNSPKRLGKDAKGNTIVHPPVSLDEHVAVQRENKVRTLLLQALPEDHMPDFHHYDDARDIWMAVKARFGGNEESKKMKKTMLKQQFAEFSVTEEEGLHKGYDRFQKILSQLNQVQARPDNDDINLKFLRALPSSWSQVALALKTRGGLESMSFDDLYNKLRSLELDVRIGHSYGVKVAAAPTHSAFIGTACSGSKPTYSDQQRIVPSVSQTSGRSDNVMECVLHSFVAENEQDQDMIYEDFDQVDQLEMEEMDLKWQMAMLSLRINRFEKKAGRKMNYNNQQPARFDRRKVRCYKCLQLGHFARECNVKTVDDKARYSAFKVTEVKTDEPKALVSVDSMVNWSDHAAENTTGEVEKVYGMMAGLHADSADASDAAKQSLSTYPVEKGGLNLFTQRLSRLVKCLLVPVSITETYMPKPHYQSTLMKHCDKSSDSETHASCDSSLKTQTKDIPPAVDIMTLPESDIEDPNSTTGSPSFSCLENVKSPRILCNKSGMNNRNVCKNNSVRVKKCFVCGSKLHLIKDCDFYNCVDSVPCNSKAASVSAGSRKSPASVPAGRSDSAASRNRPAVNSAGSRISPASVPAGRSDSAASRNRPAVHSAGSRISPASVPAGRSDSAASRNRPAVHSAGAPYHTGWSKRPATVSAGRPVSAGWLNPAARPLISDPPPHPPLR